MLHSGDKLSASSSLIGASTFEEVVDQLALIDLRVEGHWFTWHNNHGDNSAMWERLDRVFGLDLWVTRFPQSNVKALPFFGFDHSPLVFISNACIPTRPRPFGFEAMWLINNSCDQDVNEVWNINVNGSFAYSLASKLRNASFSLSKWNKTTFGNINTEIALLQNQLTSLQQGVAILETTDNEANFRKLLEFLLDYEETHWA